MMETSCVGLYVHSQGAVLQKPDELHTDAVGALVAGKDRAAIERYPWFSTSFHGIQHKIDHKATIERPSR